MRHAREDKSNLRVCRQVLDLIRTSSTDKYNQRFTGMLREYGSFHDHALYAIEYGEVHWWACF